MGEAFQPAGARTMGWKASHDGFDLSASDVELRIDRQRAVDQRVRRICPIFTALAIAASGCAAGGFPERGLIVGCPFTA